MGKLPRGYEGEAGRALAEQYESVDPAVLHQALVPHLPPAPAAILDVGAGSGRDAARAHYWQAIGRARVSPSLGAPGVGLRGATVALVMPDAGRAGAENS